MYTNNPIIFSNSRGNTVCEYSKTFLQVPFLISFTLWTNREIANKPVPFSFYLWPFFLMHDPTTWKHLHRANSLHPLPLGACFPPSKIQRIMETTYPSLNSTQYGIPSQRGNVLLNEELINNKIVFVFGGAWRGVSCNVNFVRSEVAEN